MNEQGWEEEETVEHFLKQSYEKICLEAEQKSIENPDLWYHVVYAIFSGNYECFDDFQYRDDELYSIVTSYLNGEEQ